MTNKVQTGITRQNAEPLTGGDILGLITSGMYNNPLVIYREYIQNVADSIASSGMRDNGRVEITIDPVRLELSIRDNGTGLTFSQAKRDLIPVAKSRKERQRHRGFRGIGRLSGLAFGNFVEFLTRCDARSQVTRIRWDGLALREGVEKKLPLEEIISSCVAIEKVSGDDFPPRFFEVHIGGLSRFAAASVLNKKVVREYIGEVCPVPFAADFPYSSCIAEQLQTHPLLQLHVLLNGEDLPVLRPYRLEANLSGNRLNKWVEFEEVRLPAMGSHGVAAAGWVAHSSYLGALPGNSAVRCIRARIGNIQIGDETVFDHLFSESRFNRWCVAEIHILDSRLVPNGRRDYFEPGPHLRNLENHLGALCRKLERRCRAASQERNKHRRLQVSVENLEGAYDLAASGYLTEDEAAQLISDKLLEVTALLKDAGIAEECHAVAERLKLLRQKFTDFKPPAIPPSFAGVVPSEVAVYRNCFKVLAEISPSHRIAKTTIEAILERAERQKST